MAVKPSRRLTAALISAHAVAVVALLATGLAPGMKGAVALAIAASLAHALRRHAWLRSPGSVTAIELHGEDRAAFETRGGARREAWVLGTTFVTPRLCVMNLRVAGERFARHVLVVEDNVDAGDFRRLRVELRWRCASGR